jgi:hypothetical protein
MYRVEVTRKYDFTCADGTKIKDMESKHVYKAEDSIEVARIVGILQNGLGGEYSAIITPVESEENE